MTETLAEILNVYRRGAAKPEDNIVRSFARIGPHDNPPIFIALRDEAASSPKRAHWPATATKHGRFTAFPSPSRTISTSRVCRPAAACLAYSYCPDQDATCGGIADFVMLALFLQSFGQSVQGAVMRSITFEAEPAPLSVDLDRAALVIIDMQRDFLEPGGFGESLGNDVSRLQAAVGPCREVLAAARCLGMLVIHTREGHRPDLSDAPPYKIERGDPGNRIGARGPMGRILVRGEPGHDIIPELYPLNEEPVIDKPGKGAFYQTDLELMLRNRGIDTLFVCGVTTEVCVNTTVREANDRGFRCVVLSDCCASYFPQFHEAGLAMIKAQGGIFGSVAASQPLLNSLTAVT